VKGHFRKEGANTTPVLQHIHRPLQPAYGSYIGHLTESVIRTFQILASDPAMFDISVISVSLAGHSDYNISKSYEP